MQSIDILRKLVSFPSVSADSSYAEGISQARDYLSDQLERIGFEVEVIPTEGQDVIIAEKCNHPDAQKVVIYGHYDVQPVDPLELWETDPFELVQKGERVYGRGSADNKGPLSVYLTAVEKLFKEDPDARLNVTFLLEGEEEIGSPSFGAVLKKHSERLRGDFVLACDTGSQKADQLVVTCGLRGISCLEVIATGPQMDLHSGVYGGSVMNPIQALTDVCSSLHLPDGSVNVPDFYDAVEPVHDWERDELKKLGIVENEYKSHLGVDALYEQPNYDPQEAIRFAPTLEFNGISGGYQGEGPKTVIPSKASVKISCRLVPNQDPDLIQQQLIDAIKDRCPPGISLEFLREHNGAAYKVVPPGKPNTPADQNPTLARAFEITQKVGADIFGKAPAFIREGGSIPIINDIRDILGMDSLLPGIYLPEDGMHAPNESFSLDMMAKGERLIYALLRGLAE